MNNNYCWAVRKFVSIVSASMSDSVLIGTAEKPKKQAKRKSGAGKAVVAITEAGEGDPTEDQPPSCLSSSTFLEDVICVIHHAIDVASTRAQFTQVRREKVMVDLCSLAMWFALRGKDGVSWHNATYSTWSSLRVRIWEATLSFLNLATDLGAVTVVNPVADEDDIDASQAEREHKDSDSITTATADALSHLDNEHHAAFKLWFESSEAIVCV